MPAELPKPDPVVIAAYLDDVDGALDAVTRLMAEPVSRFAAFHLQQAAEKLVKADGAVLGQQGAAVQMQLPDAERSDALKESAATGEKLESSTLASALVILPKGLLAVMIRSFIGAMSLVGRSRAPLQTFKELGLAIAWLEGQPGAAITPGLQRELEEWLAAPSK